MVSSSLDALCQVAQELDLDKKYWKGKPKFIVNKSIRNCFDVRDPEGKATFLATIMHDLKPDAVSDHLYFIFIKFFNSEGC